ncbi:hypothetical protein [Neobacillus drentensis]|uniref:hypothetical protein n=1 Tax=Neobacillus drentensis TaxID=220684 RepID=UPI0012F8D7AD|nr:hypothetical protein [Neobacillus drentensis]
MNELNEYLQDWCLKEARRTHVPNKSETVLEMWEKEKESLHPLPTNRFEACNLLSCKVNKTSLITVEPIVILCPVAMLVKLYGQNFLSIE